jgi:hypothetical protein
VYAFSKDIEHHKAAVALTYALCRPALA